MAPIRRRLNNPRRVGEDGQGQGRNMQSTATTSQQAAGDVDVRPIGNKMPPSENANNEDLDVDLVDDKFSFETAVANETKEVIWKLKRFSALATIKDSFKNARIVFQAGRSIGVPTKWILFMLRDDDDLGIYLELKENLSTENEVFVRYDTILKRADGTLYYQLNTEIVDMNNVADWGWSKLASVSKLINPESNVLVDDVLTIQVQFYIYSRQTVISKNNSALLNLKRECRNEICQAHSSMLQNKNYADITLKTNDGEEFSAHMVILAARSPVFDKMFSTEMSEKKTGMVHIDDIGGPAFKVILDFIYTGNVDSNWRDNYEQVIYGAEKYNLPMLKSYCDQTLAKACTSENALNLLKLSRLHNLIIATKMITEYIKVNVDGVLNAI